MFHPNSKAPAAPGIPRGRVCPGPAQPGTAELLDLLGESEVATDAPETLRFLKVQDGSKDFKTSILHPKYFWEANTKARCREFPKESPGSLAALTHSSPSNSRLCARLCGQRRALGRFPRARQCLAGAAHLAQVRGGFGGRTRPGPRSAGRCCCCRCCGHGSYCERMMRGSAHLCRPSLPPARCPGTATPARPLPARAFRPAEYVHQNPSVRRQPPARSPAAFPLLSDAIHSR